MGKKKRGCRVYGPLFSLLALVVSLEMVDLFLHNSLVLLEFVHPFDDLVMFLDLFFELLDTVVGQLVSGDDTAKGPHEGADQGQNRYDNRPGHITHPCQEGTVPEVRTLRPQTRHSRLGKYHDSPYTYQSSAS